MGGKEQKLRRDNEERMLLLKERAIDNDPARIAILSLPILREKFNIKLPKIVDYWDFDEPLPTPL